MQIFTEFARKFISCRWFISSRKMSTNHKIEFKILRFLPNRHPFNDCTKEKCACNIYVYVLTFESTWFMLLFSRHHRFHSLNLPSQHWFIQQVIYGPFLLWKPFQWFVSSIHSNWSISWGYLKLLHLRKSEYRKQNTFNTYTHLRFYFTGNILTDNIK